jgi:prepilin-type N-terminal cleavage/methylation domain-containing protein
MNRVVRSQQGFTLVELMLSMTFISVLLLTIAVTVIQIGNIYNKGLTMRSVDQVGRVITSDIRRVISQSQPFTIENNYSVQRHPESQIGEPDGGRLCTGTYTYIWNYGKSLESPINIYESGEEVIRFVRVRDTGGEYCANPEKRVVFTDATELLSTGDQNLAVQSFAITELATDAAAGQALYRVVMEIGTNNQDALDQVVSLNTIDTSCRPPTDSQAQAEFCAVNQFEFTAQAGSKGGI